MLLVDHRPQHDDAEDILRLAAKARNGANIRSARSNRIRTETTPTPLPRGVRAQRPRRWLRDDAGSATIDPVCEGRGDKSAPVEERIERLTQAPGEARDSPGAEV